MRDLFNVTSILQGITKDEDLYSTRQVEIPAPRFVRKVREYAKELPYPEAVEQGLEQGEERFALLNKKLIDENRLEDLKICITDEKYRHKLFAEYNI